MNGMRNHGGHYHGGQYHHDYHHHGHMVTVVGGDGEEVHFFQVVLPEVYWED